MTVPVIMLTALGTEDDRILGLEAGLEQVVTDHASDGPFILDQQNAAIADVGLLVWRLGPVHTSSIGSQGPGRTGPAGHRTNRTISVRFPGVTGVNGVTGVTGVMPWPKVA